MRQILWSQDSSRLELQVLVYPAVLIWLSTVCGAAFMLLASRRLQDLLQFLQLVLSTASLICMQRPLFVMDDYHTASAPAVGHGRFVGVGVGHCDI